VVVGTRPAAKAPGVTRINLRNSATRCDWS
jgi:hypothetical protein